MATIRRLLVPVAAAWLLSYAAIIAGTAALLATNGASADLICTCAHGDDHGSCPMHRSESDAARCRLQSTQGNQGLALLSMMGPLTLPPLAAAVVAELSPSRAIEYQPPQLSARTVSPDPPPPRS